MRTGLDVVRFVDGGWDCRVQENILPDEVEVSIVQVMRVMVTLTRARTGLMLGRQRQPVRVGTLLNLEQPIKTLPHITHSEAADSAAGNRIIWSVEDCVNHFLPTTAQDHGTDGLDLVEVERILSGHRTIESRLGKTGPFIAKVV